VAPLAPGKDKKSVKKICVSLRKKAGNFFERSGNGYVITVYPQVFLEFFPFLSSEFLCNRC
jgi:hypothetical protein